MSGSAAKQSERRFGRYVVVEALGAGAMGEVLRARDERLGREVALKTVRNVFGMHAEMFKMRFEAEARALAALSHPSIVQVHDLGIEGEEPFLVMELVDGPSLKARLAQGPMNEQEVRAMGIQLARGLEEAHARQILHRDIKPANILQSKKTGQWKLADFGVAHVPDSSVTMTGQFLGTPAYSAPEALALGQFSEGSDVFALALVLVEALTGKRIRGDGTMSELVRASATPLALPPEVPPDLARVLRLALSLEPSSRPSAHRFAELLAGHDASGAAAVSGTDATAALGPMTAPASPQAMRLITPVPTTPVPGTLMSYPGTAATPDDDRRRKKRLLLAIGGGVVVVGLIAAISQTGGGGGGGSSAPAIAPISDESFAEEEPPRDLPPITPGRIQIIPPRGLDRHSAKDFEKVVKKAYERRFGEALEKLDEFEARHGSSQESRHLRAQLEQAYEYGGGGDD